MVTRYTHAIVLDFEATCDNEASPSPQEIIEFPSVLFCLDSMSVLDEFRSYVRPFHHPLLTRFCTDFTGIRQEQVDTARLFHEVLAAHQAWLAGHGLTTDNALLVTCGDWDLKIMLPSQCNDACPPVEVIPPIYTRWLNIKRAYCEVMHCEKAAGMAGMLQSLGLPLVGHHHSGIDDCHNITAILAELIRRGAQLDVSAELSLSRYPAISLVLRLGEERQEVRLTSRNIEALRGLAGKCFKRQVTTLSRENGRQIKSAADLADLTPGEEILLG